MLFCGLLLLNAIVHPFHVTYAEAQWNPDGSRLQVALRMSPMDLDNALSKASGRRVLLEKETSEAKRALVENYLRDAIYLASSKEATSKELGQEKELQQQQRRKRFHWVGLEDEVRYTWVYFELEVPAGEAISGEESGVAAERKYWLHHRVFFETEETQINTLQLLKTDPAVAVRTSRQEPAKLLPVILPEIETEAASEKEAGKSAGGAND